MGEGVQGIYKEFFNLHLLPMYKNKLAYGTKGFPWKSNICKRNIKYGYGVCPKAEEMNKKKLITIELCSYNFNLKEINLTINCFKKVWQNLNFL